MPAEWWRVGAAALPLIALLVGLLILRWPGVRAGLVALAATLVLAATVFAASTSVLSVALWRAAALSLNVLYIVWAALLLYQVTDSTGAIKSIGDAVAHLTEDHILQLLIIGFAFSSFLQGVAGFGVPVAVTAPLLIGLGFDPLEAAAIPLVGHAWAVTMGALASAFQALLAVTGLPAQALATWIAILLGLASVATGFAVAHIHARLRPFRRAFGATPVAGVPLGAGVVDAGRVSFAFPRPATGLGWITAGDRFQFPPLGHPGALLLYTTMMTVVAFRLLRRRPPEWRTVWRESTAQGIPTSITILALAGVAMVMTYSGMTFLLARGLTRLVGPLFPFLSPFLGMLGTIITGNNTNSNVLFGVLQRDAARLLQFDPVPMAALQTAGGALGSMVAPAKVVLATATTGLAGQEGRVIRITLPYAIVLTALMGIIGLLVQL